MKMKVHGCEKLIAISILSNSSTINQQEMMVFILECLTQKSQKKKAIILPTDLHWN